MKIIIMPDSTEENYGIYGNCETQKGDPNIMQKAQESIQERFGLNDDDDCPAPSY